MTNQLLSIVTVLLTLAGMLCIVRRVTVKEIFTIFSAIVFGITCASCNKHINSNDHSSVVKKESVTKISSAAIVSNETLLIGIVNKPNIYVINKGRIGNSLVCKKTIGPVEYINTFAGKGNTNYYKIDSARGDPFIINTS